MSPLCHQDNQQFLSSYLIFAGQYFSRKEGMDFLIQIFWILQEGHKLPA